MNRTSRAVDTRIAHTPRARWRGRIRIALAIGTALVVGHASAQGAGAEWTTPGGTPEGTRYSTLNEINAGNASRLVEEYALNTRTLATHEGQPLIVGQRMYVVTPWPNKLIAYDLGNRGLVLWTFNPQPSEFARGVSCCDTVNRGAVYADGKVIYNTLDGQTVAVNALTGKQVWRTRLANPRTGETMTGAPIVAKNNVIVGNAGGELGIRGWVQALDLKTGKPRWKGWNTGPDADVKIGTSFKPYYAKDQNTPTRVDQGVTSWGGTSLWQQGGATAWSWFTYDPGLDLVYYGTANPGVWNPDMRPGDNKWAASIIARDADTGDVRWAYQVTPHDGWDFDAISESIVADLPVNGVTRKVIVHFDKNGFAYTMDRATGQVLVANKFVDQVTWADHVDLATGLPAVNPGMDPREGQTTGGICPSPLGGKEFSPASYSPRTGLFYVPAINFCMNFQPLKAMFIAGTPFLGADLSLYPAKANMGELVAWNASTGSKQWVLPEALPLWGGTLATAGDVVFYGTLDKHFKAIDANTGAKLFDKVLECGVAGNPVAFTGADGRQRIAVFTGVGWLAGGFAGGPCPNGKEWEHQQGTGDTGGTLHVFKLP